MSDARVIHWHPEAASELLAIEDYYVTVAGGDVAQKIVDSIVESVDNLAQFPCVGRELDIEVIKYLGFRALVIGEYLCFYTIDRDGINIFYIVSSRTDYIRNLGWI